MKAVNAAGERKIISIAKGLRKRPSQKPAGAVAKIFPRADFPPT
jgi:hypothetical protein